MATNGGWTGWRVAAVGAIAAALAVVGVLPVPGAAQGDRVADVGRPPKPLAIRVVPTRGLTDGQFVDVTISGSVAPVTLVQCDASVGKSPDVSTALRLCANFVMVEATERPVTVRYPVVEQMHQPPDEPLICGDARHDCVLAASGPGAVPFVSVPIDVVPGPPGPLSVRVTPDAGLTPGQGLAVVVWGGRSSPVGVAICRADVVAVGDVYAGPCLDPTEVPAGRTPTRAVIDAFNEFTGTDGSRVECDAAPGACVVAVSASGGGPLASVPLTYAGDVDITLSPATGVREGEMIRVEASGLVPNRIHWLVLCQEGPGFANVACEDTQAGQEVTSSPEGTVDATIVVRSPLRLNGRPAYCRDDCAIGVFSGAVVFAPLIAAPYTRAVVTLDASPDSGLVDGQVVELTATGLVSSYDGPPYWIFPATGQWVLAQCARNVLDDTPTIATVFTHCTPVEGGAVAVPGSTLVSDVAVTAAITPVLGGTIDCTSGPGACALVLTRVEQDGSVSLHGTDLSFT